MYNTEFNIQINWLHSNKLNFSIDKTNYIILNSNNKLIDPYSHKIVIDIAEIEKSILLNLSYGVITRGNCYFNLIHT